MQCKKSKSFKCYQKCHGIQGCCIRSFDRFLGSLTICCYSLVVILSHWFTSLRWMEIFSYVPMIILFPIVCSACSQYLLRISSRSKMPWRGQVRIDRWSWTMSKRMCLSYFRSFSYLRIIAHNGGLNKLLLFRSAPQCRELSMVLLQRFLNFAEGQVAQAGSHTLPWW